MNGKAFLNALMPECRKMLANSKPMDQSKEASNKKKISRQIATICIIVFQKMDWLDEYALEIKLFVLGSPAPQFMEFST